ncbi:uncharacterized protein EI90DRAFT_3021045 [Cantharellus anzutake]|uniref:uncharacterized protein n=1 Tax=Cantharellus anzutake TaxID=1750568 RepID=UPI0019087B0F|nr:uncharacterized protein EI90DRAFT_3021045 [Cantharellus anzutake]KAF8318323.1 hypothetical protein EI90DRAFT_3021045 [Cantharellus anzutake]
MTDFEPKLANVACPDLQHSRGSETSFNTSALPNSAEQLHAVLGVAGLGVAIALALHLFQRGSLLNGKATPEGITCLAIWDIIKDMGEKLTTLLFQIAPRIVAQVARPWVAISVAFISFILKRRVWKTAEDEIDPDEAQKFQEKSGQAKTKREKNREKRRKHRVKARKGSQRLPVLLLHPAFLAVLLVA